MLYSKLAVVLLNSIAAEKPDATNRIIAEWLLAHQEEISSIGIVDAAEQIHISTASISRFAKELGFEDFTELKQALSEGMDSFTAMHGKEEEISAAYLAAVEQGLKKASTVSMKEIRQCAESILHYDTIWIFSLLKGEAAAISLQADLRMFHKNAKTLFSYKEQMDAMKNSTRKELIILFSYTGTYFNYEGRIPSKGKIKAPIIMVSGGKNEYPDLLSQFIHFDSSLDYFSHPYTMLYIAGLISQSYAYLLETE